MPGTAPRKRPRQERAQATVEAILDAACQLLVDNGYDKTSTNKIAQRAGVSVGSLYQYFPNKEAVVLAIIERHTGRMMALLEEHVHEFLDASLEDGVRLYVRAMVERHHEDREFHRVLVQQILHLGWEHMESVERRARDLVQLILEHKRDEIVPTDTKLAAWTLVTTGESLVHRAMLAGEFDTEAVYEEICAVLLRYLFGAASPGRSAMQPA